MYGFFQDASGDLSMNRLGAFMGWSFGGALIGAGIAGFFFTEAKAEALAMAGLGAGLFTGGAWLKEHGKKLESGSQS